MQLRLNLQWKMLLLVAGCMTAILLVSSYLQGLITRSLVEDDRYNNAVGQTVAIAGRVAAYDYFNHTDQLARDLQLVKNSRPDYRQIEFYPDFKQIDVYISGPQGLSLAATTAPEAQRLAALDENSTDNELGEMERPLKDVVSLETLEGGRRHWLITAAIKGRNANGFVSALVLKNPSNDVVNQMQRRHDLVVLGAVATSVILLYLLFANFFRRPARDVVAAMARARSGDLAARALVRREDELGQISRGFNQMLDDISERDRERETLLTHIRGFNDELRERVRAATGELRAVNESLFQTQQRLARSERLATIGQIAATLAHEIGTPLNAISGHLKLLARNHPRDHDTQRRVQIVNAQLDSIVAAVRRLLARVTQRRLVLEPVDLNAVVRQALWLVAPTLEAHHITLQEQLDPHLPPVGADRDGIHQVLLNLVNNSIDAMPQGGVLRITTRQQDRSGMVELLFQDTGIGIAPEAREHLFELMWTTKTAGSGFGLAIAREIMHEHGGRIDLADEADFGSAGGNGNQGASFLLSLPLAPGRVKQARARNVNVA